MAWSKKSVQKRFKEIGWEARLIGVGRIRISNQAKHEVKVFGVWADAGRFYEAMNNDPVQPKAPATS